MSSRMALILIGIIIFFGPFFASENSLFAQGDDSIVFTSDMDGNRDIYVMDSHGEIQERLTQSDAEDKDPVWSPDRTEIAFVSNRDGRFSIYAMDAHGSNVRRITPDDSSYNESPAWSPNGNEIAYASDQTGNLEIFVIGADGANPRRITTHEAEDIEPSWSPDGRIAFISNRDGFFEIYIMNNDGSNLRQLTFNSEADNYSPSWSPDGQYIAFTAVGNGFSEIYVMNSDGTNLRVLTVADDFFAGSTTWSLDGQWIAYSLWRNRENSAIYVVDFNGQSARQLTALDFEANWPSWSSPKGTYNPGNEVVSAEVCPGVLPSRLRVNQQARVTPGGVENNVRNGPSRDNRKIGTIPPGGTFEVLEGPVCNSGFAWWRVRYQGQEGWTAESGDGEYWLESIVDLALEYDTEVASGSRILEGARGLTDGRALGPGEVQVEYYCNDQGYLISRDQYYWYCLRPNGSRVLTLGQEDFDTICQETYQHPEAFAIWNGSSSVPAFRWRCYGPDAFNMPSSDSTVLSGGRGLTDGDLLPPGEFQVEWYCQNRGYNISHDDDYWYCVDANGTIRLTLEQSDFDDICQRTYNRSDAYALQDGSNSVSAFNWRCHGDQ